MFIYDKNKIVLMDRDTQELNNLPIDACQLLNHDLARRLEKMEKENPSLSRRIKMDPYNRDYVKVGIDFMTNQAVYKPRPSLGIDLYVKPTSEELEANLLDPKGYTPAAA